MVLLIVRALLRRPSLAGAPTVTFCSEHIYNVVAKKRDASTELLQFLHAKMLEHNVDFIGGDFNMSAFSTVSDVFSDPEFSAPGNSFLWGLCALEEQYRECIGFLIMPKRPHEWRVDSQGCYKFDNATLGFGPRDQSPQFPVFLHLRTTNLPGTPTASCAANMHNKEDWNAGITNTTVREEDVHDRDTVRQGHVSAFLFTPPAVARESLAGQLCLSTALTHKRFASSLCLCLCQCLCHCLCLQCHQSTGSDGPPPALSQVTLCQPRSLRLPRSSPLPHSLERCISVSASLPPPLPIPTPPLDAASQTIPHIAVSQDVSTQLSLAEFSLRCVHPHNPSRPLAPSSTFDVRCPACARPVPSLPLDAAVQTPLWGVASRDASTQLPLTEFFIACIFSNDPVDHQASPPQPTDIATLCSPSSASHAGDGYEHTSASRVLLEPPPGLEKYARQCASHGIPVKAAPVRPRLCTSISVTPPQPQVSTTQVGTHPVRSATTYKRSASTALVGTHSPIGSDPRAGTGPFPKPRALVLPMVHFGQSKPDGHSGLDTAGSDLMHHQYRLSVLQ